MVLNYSLWSRFLGKNWFLSEGKNTNPTLSCNELVLTKKRQTIDEYIDVYTYLKKMFPRSTNSIEMCDVKTATEIDVFHGLVKMHTL